MKITFIVIGWSFYAEYPEYFILAFY